MRIGIDMSRTAETKTGLSSYAQSLVAALARVDRSNDYVVHPFTWHCFVRDYHLAYCPRQRNFRRARRWLPRRLVTWLWESGRADKDWLVGPPADVWFSPFHSVPPVAMGRLVCTFHDVAFRTHPQFATDWNREFCERQIARAALRAERILTVSQFSKREIVQHVGIPADRIDVVLEAADPRFRILAGAQPPARVRAWLGTGRRFMLYAGSVEPRKNLITLVRALARLADAPPLVIAGGSGWKNSDVLAEIERQGLAARVLFAGFVTDQELVALYNTATVFVFPTLYEGFGLPVVEAMACGAPVLTTRTSSIPEVGGDAVLYCERPADADELAAQLRRLLADDGLRARLRERGLEQASRFSWERAARETIAVFEKAWAGDGRPVHELRFGTDERALGRGWHEPEAGEGGAWCWTWAAATLRLQPRGAHVQLEVGTPAEGQCLMLRCGLRMLGAAKLAPGWQTLAFELGALAAERELELRLEVDPLPAAQRGADPRELGVMVRRVWT
jgi:glycosyltransferase involved in cell wall biosynthesis